MFPVSKFVGFRKFSICSVDINYLDTILKKYPLGAGDTIEVPLADMSHTFSNDQVSGIIVFRSVNATLDVREDTMSYWFEVASVYLKEK